MLARRCLLVVAATLLAAPSARAITDDRFTSGTQPANALLMPFDVSAGHTSFLSVSNPYGRSPEAAAVQTHWVFWSETCDHLVDVSMCLTLGDSVVVDPMQISAIDIANRAVGPTADLSGSRGFVTVTAFETDAACRTADPERPLDDAIVGAFTLANLTTGSAFGGDAIGLGLDPTGSFTELPNALLSPTSDEGFLDIQTFDPTSLEDSTVVLLAVQESVVREGRQGGFAAVEVGPLRGVTANLSFFDTLEVRTSLPDVVISCATFSSVRRGPGSLAPDSVTLASSGVFRLTGIRGPGGTSIGGTSWVYGFHGQAVGPYGAGSSARYPFVEGPAPGTPTPGPSPTGAPASTPPQG